MALDTDDVFLLVSHRFNNLQSLSEPPFSFPRTQALGRLPSPLPSRDAKRKPPASHQGTCTRYTERSSGSLPTSSRSSVPARGTIFMATIQAVKPRQSGDMGNFLARRRDSSLAMIPNTLDFAVSWPVASQIELSGIWNPSFKKSLMISWAASASIQVGQIPAPPWSTSANGTTSSEPMLSASWHLASLSIASDPLALIPGT